MMQWVEVIQLRITKPDPEQIIPILQQLAEDASEEDSCQEVHMYRRAHVNTDLSILLWHDILPGAKSESSLGLRISAALKEFGMVNHNTWFEIDF
ncbi:hypothetical protein [Desulfopila sp. IMCC35008]|uniref:hypothetical protein n=1 Tax=Desulfopila sp. IMCC35008 TaxID=2653858 RepID=UPI0013D0ABF7|nr:hypothetical protein [Desulfopila sp. IMCC35008]